MRLGVMLGYWNAYTTPAEQVELAREADRLGYHSLWVAEAYGSDAVTVMTWLAAHTERIAIGAAVLQIPARTPAMTAMTAATLDILTNGRVLLGLGVSGPQVAEGWHGQRSAHPMQRTREYVDILRLAWRRETVEYQGEIFQLPLPDGPGKPLKLIIHPLRERIPIYLGAIGPHNIALTAEIAEGWIPAFYSPDKHDVFKEALDAGAAKRAPELGSLDLAPFASVAVGDDVDALRDLLRPNTALYVGGMGSRQKNFYNQLVQRYGFAPAAREIQALYLGGKQREAMAAIPPELLDMTALVGPKERIADRLPVYEAAGVNHLIVSPLGRSLEDRLTALRTLAEVAL